MKPGRNSKVQSSKSSLKKPRTASRTPHTAPFDFIKEKAGIREFRMTSNGLQLLLLPNRVAPVATFAIEYTRFLDPQGVPTQSLPP